MDNEWAFNLEYVIMTIVKTKIETALKTDYPNIFITNNGKSTAKPVFPTVYIHELPGTEKSDLEGSAINAVLESFQVDVTTNTSQSDAKKVCAVVAQIFKELRFQISSMPEISDDGETYRSTCRVRRWIGADDTI